MPSYLQYHNGCKLGWVPLEEKPFGPAQLAIYTRRALVRQAIGSMVYLITSLGSPRQYYLWECFCIDQVRELEGQFCASGPGWQLTPPQRLEGAAFEQFRQATGYFIGFQCIDKQPYLRDLQQLATSFRKESFDQQTLAFCEELIRCLPENGDSYYCRGVVRQALGQRTESLADFARALQLGSEFTAAAQRHLHGCQSEVSPLG